MADFNRPFVGQNDMSDNQRQGNMFLFREATKKNIFFKAGLS